MNLTNKLTEEEIYAKINEYFKEVPQRPIAQLIIDIIKPLDVIRKSSLKEARENTDALINQIQEIKIMDLSNDQAIIFEDKKRIKQLIQTEREAADKKIKPDFSKVYEYIKKKFAKIYADEALKFFNEAIAEVDKKIKEKYYKMEIK